MKYSVYSEAQTAELAARFAENLKPGDSVALYGDLGAGKSVFCRAVMRALGVTERALPSPTFSIIQEYEGRGCRIAHMDWYRLEDRDEIEMLGVREYFRPPWICLIEWPARAESLLTSNTIRVHISPVEGEPEARQIEVLKPV